MDFSELIAAADPSIFTESIKAWVSGLNINSVIMLIMMIFMIVGAIDRIRGNKLGYGEKFWPATWAATLWLWSWPATPPSVTSPA